MNFQFQTNFQGRLRNTDLPKRHGLLPVFEAVINSIHSLEERGNLKDGHIIVTIERETQTSIVSDNSHYPEIDSFLIEDNGIGFNDANMESFVTLDSEHKISKGCRGVGRLLWLKAFSSVEIESSFHDKNENIKQRLLNFDVKNGFSVKEVPTTANRIKTCVHLRNFDKKYRSATPKGIDAIARALLEHCLWYFVSPEGVPIITIRDSQEEVILNKLYNSYMRESAQNEIDYIKGHRFILTHVKFRALFNKKHSLALCAANRLVKEEPLKIGGLYGKIADKEGDFTYSCYVSSPYLDEQVRSERTAFNIAEDADSLFPEELNLEEIRKHISNRVEYYLNEHLLKNIELGKNRIHKFVSEKAPRYRPLLRYLNQNELAIDSSISDKELDILLHKHLAELERNMINQGHDVMSSFDGDITDYKDRLNLYLQTASDIKQSDLANYVMHRKVIIELLEKFIQMNDSGKYAREDIIHQLIMPMGKESNDLCQDVHNLWLIDERLAFHHYLASDKTLNSMPITGDKSTKEPDILALNVYDKPILFSEKKSPPLASITIVEIKRPMRNDMSFEEDKNPVVQALKYLDKVREGQVKTVNGLLIPNSSEIPGYCYIISDLTPTMKEQCKMLDLTVTSDHMGYFGYNKGYKAYIEVISYNKLVNAANERNKAFFDKLGLPSN